MFFQNGQVVFGETNIATAGGTTNMSSTSTQIQNYTGSLTQTVVLPNATSCVVGQFWEIFNSSSGLLTLQYYGGASFSPSPTLSPGTSVIVKLVGNGSSAGTWAIVASASGASSGSGKNYLSAYTASTGGGAPNPGNGNFENSSTSGWSLAHSGLSAGLVPTSVATATNPFSSSSGGSAASSNLSLSIVSSGQLSGSYSGNLASSAASVAGDMLISNAFNIDKEDQSKLMTVQFAFSTTSGASNLNFSGSSSNSFAIYIYDVTNAVWIQPTNVYGMAQVGGVGKTFAQFQSSSNGTQYQLAIVNINASSGAYSLYVDDLSVGPTQFAGFVGQVPQFLGSMKISGGTFSTTSSTLSNFPTSSGNTYTASGSLRAPASQIPGFVIPYIGPGSIIITSSIAGNGWQNASPNNGSNAFFAYSDGTNQTTGFTFGHNTGYGVPTWVYGTVGPQVLQYTSGQSNLTIQLQGAQPNGGTLSNQGLEIEFDVFYFPSTQQQIVSQYDGRTVAAQVTINTNTTLNNATPTIFNVVNYDSHGAYNASTGVYTCPVSGIYSVDLAGLYVTSGGSSIGLYKNSAYYGTIATSIYASSQLAAGALSVKCVAGDQLYIAGVGASNTMTYGAGSIQPFVSFSLLSGAQQILAGQRLVATYYVSTNTSFSANTAINFDTQQLDTAGMVSNPTTNWKFTAPVTGEYLFATYLEVTGSSSNFYYSISGSRSESGYIGGAQNAADAAATSSANLISLNAGDTIQFFPDTNCTLAGGSLTHNDRSRISIKQI